jgi:hypothetical protein
MSAGLASINFDLLLVNDKAEVLAIGQLGVQFGLGA